MQCPKCQSDNTQRLEVVFENGTQTINTTSHSAGAGSLSGSLGFGGVSTSTTGISQSTSAAKSSPPAKKKLKWYFLLMFIGLLMTDHVNGIPVKTLGYLTMLGSAYFVYLAFKYNSTVWPTYYKIWKESWLCHKCGEAYHQPF